jgi:poly(A) polymerase
MVPKADPALAREAATGIVRTLRGAGHTAYFAGGCVRDELLGLAPTDFDVATDATPERIKGLFPRTDEVGASFGVVLVKTARATVEVATFRSDGPYSDRRRPDVVHFSTPERDAARRDFTINALFLDPLAPAEDGARGRVIDFVGGRDDMRRRVLRAVGDPGARLAEDHLRALRAVRFAARLGLAIDPATATAIRAHAAQLKGVSRERIGEEVKRMLTDPRRARAVELLRDLRLEAPVLNEPERGGGLASLAGLGDGAAYAEALAAWALDRGQGPGAAGVWRRSLCLSNEDREAMRGILEAVDLIEGRWAGLGVAGRKRAAARACFGPGLGLVSLRNSGLGGHVRAEVEELARTGLAPAPILTGEDLIAMGLEPGPLFRRVLDGVYDAQLEGRVAQKEEARVLAKALAAQGDVGRRG